MKIFELLKLTTFYEIILPFAQKMELNNWYRRGRIPPTPQAVKQNLIRDLAQKYSLDTFVETGTYLGSTTDAVKNIFNKIFTIELDKVLFKRASQKFEIFKNITVFQGDSAKVLPKVLKKIKNPAIFWLDAHYSKGITTKGAKETPIWEELTAILGHKIKYHVLLIDDADAFTGKNDYPKITKINKIISKHNYNSLKIYHNIIVITPKPRLYVARRRNLGILN